MTKFVVVDLKQVTKPVLRDVTKQIRKKSYKTLIAANRIFLRLNSQCSAQNGIPPMRSACCSPTQKFQNRFMMIVWYGTASNNIIGRFISKDTVNADRYLNTLQENIWPEVNTRDNIEDLIFMQDGAPPRLWYRKPCRFLWVIHCFCCWQTKKTY